MSGILNTEEQAVRQKELRLARRARYAATDKGRKHTAKDKKLYAQNQILTRPFIAYDGEGVTHADGSHSYNLLACSDGFYIEDYKNSLSAVDCMEFLLAGKDRHPNAIHVIFGGTYDINMMLKELPHKKLGHLWKQGRCWWDGYTISYRHRKEYVIAHGTRRLTLYDVQTFFQCSFITACDNYLGDWAGRDDVVRGKESRGEFTAKDKNTTRHYCFRELSTLVLLMVELRYRLQRVGLRPARWDGPGAVATALFKRESVKEHLDPTPPERLHAVRCAYFGGRFEVKQFGHYNKEIYEYDINSAYPSAMRHLPSLAMAKWTKRPAGYQSQDSFALTHLSYELPRVTPEETALLGPVPSRYKDGSIAYPASGRGWYWEVEAKGLREWVARCGGTTRNIATLECKPVTDVKPFSFLNDLYEQRRVLKEAGDGAERACKLAINSLYGKTCQQLGWRRGEDGRPVIPPYHQLEYAGFITASCRAQIWQAVMLNPSAIVAIETDAVFSTEPLNLTIGTGLGEWEETRFTNLTYVQSGTYWADTPDGKEVHKYRGFDKGTISRADVLALWETEQWANGIPGMETRFGGMGEALSRNNWSAHCRWVTAPRTLATNLDGKRRHTGRPFCPVCEVTGWEEAVGFDVAQLHPTECIRDHITIDSLPCSIEWLDDTEYDKDSADARRDQRDYD
jgi:hypothetical protein